MPIINLNNNQLIDINSVEYCFGMQCLGFLGLKSYQRSCKVIKGLKRETVSTNCDSEQNEIINEVIADLP